MRSPRAKGKNSYYLIPLMDRYAIIDEFDQQLYREDEPDCSELCQCGEDERLTCHTICVESSPCKTDFAFYNHEAPAYQAHRGPCLCYSGRFICMRPSPGEINKHTMNGHY